MGDFFRTHRPLRRRSAISSPRLLTFSLNELQYALPLDHVERVVRAAAVTPLPRAPDIVLGILDLHGTVVPVFDVRKRFGLPEKELLPEHQFVIARAGGRLVALAVDAACGVLEGDDADPLVQDVPEAAAYLSGVTRTDSGLVLIHDLERFLSPREEDALAAALAGGEG